MPKAPPKGTKLTGSVSGGYKDLLETRAVEMAPKEILEDPSVVAALDINKGIGELPDLEPAETEGEGAELPEGVPQLRGRIDEVDPYEDLDTEDIGNGTTIPFRWRGRPTLTYTTCSEPEKDKNRGCALYYRCPLRGLGSGNLVFMDTKTKQIRHETCIQALLSGIIANRRYQLLPGVTFAMSYEAKWADWPDGTPCKVGPNEPKTHLVKIPVKNPVPATFHAELIRQYEILRRKGEVA